MILSRYDFGPVKTSKGNFTALWGVGNELLELGSHSQDDLDALLQLTSARRFQHGGRKMMVVDCGANVGPYTIPWAKFMEGWGEILAIEAQERLFYALAGNIALNNCFNAKCIWAAVADREGVIKGPTVDYLSRPTNLSGMSMLVERNEAHEHGVEAYETLTPTLSIDSLNLPRLDVLKIDVEGMEGHVLRGARKTIDKHWPIIHVEWVVSGVDAIKENLPPDYKIADYDNVGPYGKGNDFICMHKDDQIWQSIKFSYFERVA